MERNSSNKITCWLIFYYYSFAFVGNKVKRKGVISGQYSREAVNK